MEGYQDKRITYLEKPWSGACDTRNFGKAQARGDFIAFPSTDFKLMPGCIRKWLMWFQDFPESTFVYGGYRLMQEGKPVMDFPSEPFDVNQLKYYNYIDGGFPVKREACPDWDPAIKSLNDWDFWLQVVLKGGVGKYMMWDGKPEISYMAEIPRAGGLSYDSQEHWIERMEQIKRKHGIPIHETVVTSLGAPIHAKRIAPLIGADFLPMPSFKPHHYQNLYLLGYYASTNQDEVPREVAHIKVFAHPTERGKPAEGCKIIHWIGTDVSLLGQKSMNSLRAMKGLFKHMHILHLCECSWMQEELKELGIEAAILPLPISTDLKMSPLPERFSVGIYLPTGDATTDEKYCKQLMKDIIKTLPDVDFKIFGDRMPGKFEHEEHLGWVPIQEAIDRCTINLRVTPHDGLPITPIEFLIAGREVITSVPLPGAICLGNHESYTSLRESIVDAIRQCQDHPREPVERTLWRDHWLRETRPDIFLARFHANIASHQRKNGHVESLEAPVEVAVGV